MTLKIFVAFVLFSICRAQDQAINQAINDAECPSGVFYADVKSMTITCYSYPMMESKLATCFKDLWWKYVIDAQSIGAAYPSTADPSKSIDQEFCARRCLCQLILDLSQVDCLRRGRPPVWSDSAFGRPRKSFHCRRLNLPDAVTKKSKNINLEVKLENLNMFSDNLPLLDEVAEALGELNVDSLIVRVKNSDQLTYGRPITSIDRIFSNSARLPKLKSFEITPILLKSDSRMIWPTANAVLSNLSPNLKFLIYDHVNTSLSAIDQSIPAPSFAPNLLSFVIRRSPIFSSAPDWLKLSTKLLVLQFSEPSPEFRFTSLPRLQSLLSFSFMNVIMAPSSPTRFPPNLTIAAYFPNLEYLDLSNIQAEIIPTNLVTGLTNLRYLDLSNNNLTPMPSFKNTYNLRWLSISGITPLAYGVYESGTTLRQPAGTAKLCQYGKWRNLNLKREHFRELTNLEILDTSFYENLQIDDDAFVDLIRLTEFYAQCCNLRTLPQALRYTCGIRQLIAYNNSFNINESSSIDWSLPVFIPKSYKSLRNLDLSAVKWSKFPSTLFAFFDTQTNTKFFETIQATATANPGPWNDQCERYKFQKVYNLPSTVTNFTGTGVCDTQLDTQLADVRREMSKQMDYCPKLASAASDTVVVIRDIRMVLPVVMMLVNFWAMIKNTF